jgi:hypothetical protein
LSIDFFNAVIEATSSGLCFSKISRGLFESGLCAFNDSLESSWITWCKLVGNSLSVLSLCLGIQELNKGFLVVSK